MKTLITLLALSLSLTSLSAQGSFLEEAAKLNDKLVLIDKNETRKFRFVGEVEGDSCNSITMIAELEVLSSSASSQMIALHPSYMQTVMGCSDNSIHMRTVTSPWYRRTQNKLLIFQVPYDFEVEFQ